MAVKLRLQRKGRKAAPFYHIVVADSRSPRDGKFIEKIGTYNPLTIPASIELNNERASYWLGVGAQPTDTVNAILRFKGVLYAKHLQKGVAKGAFDQAKADELLAKWLEEKNRRIEKQREATKEEKKKFATKVDGTAKVKVKPTPEPVEEEVAPEAGDGAIGNIDEAISNTIENAETAQAAEEKVEEQVNQAEENIEELKEAHSGEAAEEKPEE